ncbi:hypothetical protein CCACVL1_09883 [Corchorus capsularis]|uniref:LsmAD domain-containing protein n=1 Tax=Corchorus capsularis TaxID=210143 RepID=A0A1R3ITS7_COCAP|nr:hypothetical protein CCACVL1_09883 [Corchorus capsularis]
MALMSLASTSILKFGLSPQTRLLRRRSFVTRASPGFLTIRAVQENGSPRRLVDIIRLVPDISRNYFRSPSRRALFGGISLLGGFYVAQTISLSFGALGVNDVIAAVLCVLLTEYFSSKMNRQQVVLPKSSANGFGHRIDREVGARVDSKVQSGKSNQGRMQNIGGFSGVAVTRDGFARTGSKAIWCKKFFQRVYTTKLERGPQMRQLEKEAMRRAREIEGEDTHDLHLAEERGLHLHDNLDIVEEMRYSSVCRGSRVDDSGFEEEDIIGFPQHGDFGENSGSLGKRPVDLTNLQSIDGAEMMTSSSLVGEAQTSQATIGADLNHSGSYDQAR